MNRIIEALPTILLIVAIAYSALWLAHVTVISVGKKGKVSSMQFYAPVILWIVWAVAR